MDFRLSAYDMEGVMQLLDSSTFSSISGAGFFGSGLSAGPLISAQDSQEIESPDRRRIEALKRRDAEVKRHEQAHLAASGGHAQGGASYQYVTGPDGKRYAVGGEVSIDVSEVSGDPEATIRKAQVIRRAALAPASPSPQDRSVAQAASKMELKARQELARMKKEEQEQYDRTGQPAEADPPVTTVERAA
jgi:hypothetical protein